MPSLNGNKSSACCKPRKSFSIKPGGEANLKYFLETSKPNFEKIFWEELIDTFEYSCNKSKDRYFIKLDNNYYKLKELVIWQQMEVDEWTEVVVETTFSFQKLENFYKQEKKKQSLSISRDNLDKNLAEWVDPEYFDDLMKSVSTPSNYFTPIKYIHTSLVDLDMQIYSIDHRDDSG